MIGIRLVEHTIFTSNVERVAELNTDVIRPRARPYHPSIDNPSVIKKAAAPIRNMILAERGEVDTHVRFPFSRQSGSQPSAQTLRCRVFLRARLCILSGCGHFDAIAVIFVYDMRRFLASPGVWGYFPNLYCSGTSAARLPPIAISSIDMELRNPCSDAGN